LSGFNIAMKDLEIRGAGDLLEVSKVVLSTK
jgi:transcription-repair coupling factor (superfamily II helicase)